MQTLFPCRIRHQRGLTEPILTIPHRAFLAALDCLRGGKRRAALDAVKDRTLLDPDSRRLIRKFENLDRGVSGLVDKLENTDYGIPETVKGVISIRQLVSLC